MDNISKKEKMLELMKTRPELFKPRTSKTRRLLPSEKGCFVSPEGEDELLKITSPPAIHYYAPSSVTDTSAPSCATEAEDIMYNQLANFHPRVAVFKIANPATFEVDEVFTAAMIERYRGKSNATEVTAPVVEHEELAGASVLKRFREEVGMSSGTVTTDSSAPTTVT